jgi:predicted MPP superfamily phosphohydrolase
MRLPYIVLAILLFVNIFIDGYTFMAIRSYLRKTIWSKIHAIIAILSTIALIFLMLMPVRSGDDNVVRVAMWTVYTLISLYLPKYLFVIFDILSRVPLMFKGQQKKGFSVVGAVIGFILFIAMWWGALINRFNSQIEYIVIEDVRLPKSFNNYSIVQISDLHLGTYGNDTTYISKIVNEVNELNADVILFTGDIVNRNSNELRAFTKTLSRLKAKHGVYSILGNHDYGDYEDWDTPAEKEANMQALKDMQASMGWKMLNNTHEALTIGNDSIILIGVENIGDAPFPTYGDLSKAYSTPSDNQYKILMSHNPAHWTNDIENNKANNIALTLAGHTHAMQTEICGLSPAYFRYRTWGGMYNDDLNHRLYVNIGIGTVGFPARIGATPEITHFTLKTTH